MKIEKFFKNSPFKITFNDLVLDENKEIFEQLDNLKEDLFQAQHQDEILDIGWYPSFSEKGKFVISIIRDYDWENPIFKKEVKEIKDLLKIIVEVLSRY